jgi:hypothetical protein
MRIREFFIINAYFPLNGNSSRCLALRQSGKALLWWA